MKTFWHEFLSVRRALRQNIELRSKRGLWLIGDDGHTMDREKAINVFMDTLAAGIEYLPLSNKPCEGWSDKTGCPGHARKDTGEDESP